MNISQIISKKYWTKAVIPATALIVSAMSTLLPQPASAAGLLVADGGFGGRLEIKEHDVNVTINNGIAVTKVTEIFHNTENRQVEALYTFPVPKRASVANFSMWINGKEVIGEVLEKEKARQIYNSYKQVRRDPGLLEQVDYKRFEMRIFPIAPQADQKIEITYYQELDIDHDEVTYVYPLATVTDKSQDSSTTGRFSFQLEAKSPIPITHFVSPSHTSEFVIAEHSDIYKMASLEQQQGSLADDIVVNYGLSRPNSGIDLLTSKTSRDDGFFYLTVTAGEELAKHDLGMDYIFLLDISGSMANSNKLKISNRSLDAFINELGPKDRFEVLTFNVRPETLFAELQAADEQAKITAIEYLNSQTAKGGTILAPALTTAYKYGDPDRPLNVIILSDGMTEQKERQELIRLIGQRPSFARVFCIGIGNEINRPLLEQIAHDSGGLAAFVSGGDDFSRQAKAFRRKLMHPAVSNIGLQIDGVSVYDLSPAALPNLYHGSPVRIYGRYKGDGEAQVSLNGQVMGKDFSQTLPLNFPKRDSTNPEIERMWAQKRIDGLLKDADRNNARTSMVDEVIELGETFSIVTEYTSFLVLENDAEYQRWKIERRNQNRLTRDRNAQRERQQSLTAIRNKALQDIGPQAVATGVKPKEQIVAQKVSPKVQTQVPQNNNQQGQQTIPERQQSRDFNFGSGPVGPFFLALAMLMRRKKLRNC